MNLTVNTPAVASSSRGVRRYFATVMQHLQWPGKVELLAGSSWRPWERLRELLRRGRSDAIFWTPCQRGPIRCRNHVITVHDCINVEYVYRNDWRLSAYRQLTNTIFDGAERIVAISQATKDAVLRNYRVDERKIVIIRSGRTEMTGACEARSPQNDAESFVLMVTNALPHKNNRFACEGFARSGAVARGVALRVVGELTEDARSLCHRLGVRLQEHHAVSDAELSDWYAQALFLLGPSLAEGHDLPVAEALSMGANVLCSDIPVHREFYEGEVRFFDPARLESLVTAIDAGLAAPGRWFATTPGRVHRSFIDVAEDYRALFGSLA